MQSHSKELDRLLMISSALRFRHVLIMGFLNACEEGNEPY